MRRRRIRPTWRASISASAAALLLGAGLRCGDHAPPAGVWQTVLHDQPGALLSVWGYTERDVYVVGADSRDSLGPQVLHYDGAQWLRLDTGVDAGSLWWAYGVAPDTVYMVGT